MASTTTQVMNNLVEPESEEFSPLLVSTTTVTSVFKSSVNIVDIAKYLPLDEVVIGRKLVYAGGSSTIIQGVARISKKKKDFYNQVTFTLRLPMEHSQMRPSKQNKQHDSILVSCKIFHNGTLHVTGTHTLDEAKRASNLLLERLKLFSGAKMISLDVKTPYLKSHDNLIFSTTGKIIGWSNTKLIYLNNEYVVLDNLRPDNLSNDTYNHESARYPVFVSTKWVNNSKNIYTLEGKLIGTRTLFFKTNISKRHFEVKYLTIYSGKEIVGKEVLDLFPNYLKEIEKCDEMRHYFLSKGAIVHTFLSFNDLDKWQIHEYPFFEEKDFTTHMINTFFKAPFKICRKKLHKTFLEAGFYSRFDPCSNAAVNLRFHYNLKTVDIPDQCGKCPDLHQPTCNCKDISISCFNSGKMNVTGLATLEQGKIVYDFLKTFFVQYKPLIIGVV